MAVSTDNQAFHPKSVYDKQYSTEGQTQVVSSGAYQLFESGGRLDMRGEMLQSVVLHSSNSTTISNRGFKVFTSIADIHMLIEPPVTGSNIKLIMHTTAPDKDNAVFKFHAKQTATDTTNIRIGMSTGRMLQMSTSLSTKTGLNKTIELIGTTQFNGRRMWLIANIGHTTGAVLNYTISSSTA